MTQETIIASFDNREGIESLNLEVKHRLTGTTYLTSGRFIISIHQVTAEDIQNMICVLTGELARRQAEAREALSDAEAEVYEEIVDEVQRRRTGNEAEAAEVEAVDAEDDALAEENSEADRLRQAEGS